MGESDPVDQRPMSHPDTQPELVDLVTFILEPVSSAADPLLSLVFMISSFGNEITHPRGLVDLPFVVFVHTIVTSLTRCPHTVVVLLVNVCAIVL